MSTWLSLAKSAPGLMVELLERKTSLACLLAGHRIVWRSDTVACANCRHTFKAATDTILDGLSTLEGQAMGCRELRS